MNEFPYAQQIIWENDIEQIEWKGYVDWSVLYISVVYLVRTNTGENVIGAFQQDEENLLEFVTSSGWNIELDKLVCWAKL